MSFYVICVCFSFWSLMARCFYVTLGEAFLSHPHCLYMISFHLSHFQQRRTLQAIFHSDSHCDWYENKSERLLVCFHLVLFRYLLAFFCSRTRKVENEHQPSKYLVQLLWQVTNQAALCLIQHCVCWKTESCGWNSETINLTVGKTSQGKESWTQREHIFFGTKWAQAASCVLGKLHLLLYYLFLLKYNLLVFIFHYFFSETSQLILDTLPTVTRFLLLWQVTQKIIWE